MTTPLTSLKDVVALLLIQAVFGREPLLIILKLLPVSKTAVRQSLEHCFLFAKRTLTKTRGMVILTVLVAVLADLYVAKGVFHFFPILVHRQISLGRLLIIEF